jgi:hypothetical protein
MRNLVESSTHRIPSVIVFFSLLLGYHALSLAQTPDVNWIGQKTYRPSSIRSTHINGFGINATVDELPAGTGQIVVSKRVKNTTSVAVPAGYNIHEKIVKLGLRVVVGGSAGYVPGAVIVDFDQSGPALSPNQTTPVLIPSQGVILLPQPSCGLYLETLTVMGHSQRHFFYIPSNMDVRIRVRPPGQQTIDHAAAPGQIATLIVTRATPQTRYRLFYNNPVVGTMGSEGRLVAPRPSGAIWNGIARVTYRTTRLHTHNPGMDFPMNEEMNGMITVITVDGCTIRQKSVRLRIVHHG